jgi:hypothetical protein
MKETIKSPHAVSFMRQCLYCRIRAQDTTLTKEHIVPAGLGGKRYIEEASCDRCADKTKKIEEQALRSYIRPVRIYMKLSKRHKKDTPKTFTLYRRSHFLRTKTPFVPFEVSIDDLPIDLRLPEYPDPGFLNSGNFNQNQQIFRMIQDASLQRDYTQRINRLVWRYGEIQAAPQAVPHAAWMRMLAKIAHCAMMARRRFWNVWPVLPEVIFSADDGQILNFVGGAGIANLSDPSSPLHQIRFGTLPSPMGGSYVIAELTLFSRYRVPRYLILCGVDLDPRSARAPYAYLDLEETKKRPLTQEFIIWGNGEMFTLMPVPEGEPGYPDYREEP